MATETVATEHNPEAWDAAPLQGNFTTDASMHLWCARALSVLVASPQQPLESCSDDIQEAIRYLLELEIARALKAQEAGK